MTRCKPNTKGRSCLYLVVRPSGAGGFFRPARHFRFRRALANGPNRRDSKRSTIGFRSPLSWIDSVQLPTTSPRRDALSSFCRSLSLLAASKERRGQVAARAEALRWRCEGNVKTSSWSSWAKSTLAWRQQEEKKTTASSHGLSRSRFVLFELAQSLAPFPLESKCFCRLITTERLYAQRATTSH